MMYGVLAVVLQMLAAIAAAAVLVLGFAFLIFLGDAEARGTQLVSGAFDRLATFVVYAAWFAPLWWFGFSAPLLMVACGITAFLCAIYAASYSTAMARRPQAPLP